MCVGAGGFSCGKSLPYSIRENLTLETSQIFDDNKDNAVKVVLTA